ncbi:hypothetical protein OTU49_009113 [Cherax quadricarinatus]|uniref:Uncharacterized protein n=1 Tax=Cherax quadricarinatus TaxID=27406 RepID=A0AAW0Y443_CHEQU
MQKQQQQQQQQHEQKPSQLLIDDLAPPVSPCSDVSVTSHVSHGSIQQESNVHYSSKSVNKERYYRKIEFPPEVSRSLSSRLSGSCEEEKKEDHFLHMMVMSPSGSASSHTSGGGYGVEQQYLGCSNGAPQYVAGADTAAATAAVCSTAAQVVQIAAVPFSPVIPLNPVVTNLSVQLPPVPTTEGLRQSLVLSPDQKQLQDQLRRKHAELKQQILRQQEELRQVNDQLIMAQYGSLSVQQVYKYSSGLQCWGSLRCGHQQHSSVCSTSSSHWYSHPGNWYSGRGIIIHSSASSYHVTTLTSVAYNHCIHFESCTSKHSGC